MQLVYSNTDSQLLVSSSKIYWFTTFDSCDFMIKLQVIIEAVIYSSIHIQLVTVLFPPVLKHREKTMVSALTNTSLHACVHSRTS